MEWAIEKNGTVIQKGHPADIRELMETLIEEEIGLFLSLQEDEDEGDVYLHSEYVDGLTEEEIERVIQLGFTEDPESTTIETFERLTGLTLNTHS